MRLIALGFSNKEIAARLRVSVKTVETYKTRPGEAQSARPGGPREVRREARVVRRRGGGGPAPGQRVLTEAPARCADHPDLVAAGAGGRPGLCRRTRCRWSRWRTDRSRPRRTRDGQAVVMRGRCEAAGRGVRKSGPLRGRYFSTTLICSALSISMRHPSTSFTVPVARIVLPL